MSAEVPKSLRVWFMVHFIVDMIFAIPLMVNPVWFLGLFGFNLIDPLTARLVGAALIGIGGESFFMNKKGIESYHVLLTLKILWSVSAVVAIGLSIFQGGPKSEWLFLAIFFVFSIIWIYYKRRLISSE